ncbi:hypothetical protein D3C78_1432140 [compost metagenome]
MPVLVADLEDGRARAMAGAVHQHVDAAPLFAHRVDQALQVVVRLVAAGHADTAELPGQRLALAGGGEDADPEAVRREAPGCGRSHAAACGGDDRYFFY